jgi:C_GCAxxG_C_C family probable redox protein
LDKQTSLKLTTGFGGGFANQGEICGAVVGAFLVFGLKFGIDNSNDKQNREKTYQIIDRFEKEFVKNYGSIKCNELLNIDMSNKIERINAKKNGVFKTKCPIFVQKATEIVDKLLDS